MGFFARHRKAFRSVIASFGMLFGLLAGCGSAPKTIGNEPVTSVAKEPSKASIDLNIAGLSINTSGESGVFSKTDSTGISGSLQHTYGFSKNATLIFISSFDEGVLSITLDSFSTLRGSVDFFGEPSPTIGKQYSYRVKKDEQKKIKLSIDAQLGLSKDCHSKIGISNISLTPIETFSTTFEPNENLGQMYVDGNKVAQSTTMSRQSDSCYILKFEPVEGYTFLGWDVNGTVESSENPFQFYPKSNNQVIKPKLASSSLANFSVGGIMFSALDEAIAKAKSGSDKTIVAVKDGTVASGNYTLDSGLSLLIPNSESATLSDYATEKPSYVNSAEPYKQYRKLKLENGVNLRVLGQIVVCAKPLFKGPNDTGIPTGAYGLIELEPNALIKLENGAKLYAWGFVTGSGMVWATTGSTVYEMFQITSWRGGTASQNMNNSEYKVFIINQYYVQNIEARLKIEAGATERTITGMYMTKFGVSDTANPCFTFIGSGGMFSLKSGYLIKAYDPLSDRLNVAIYGNGLLSSLSFKISLLTFVNVDFDSNNYALPITNNISVTVMEGQCIMNQDLAFLPGSELSVRQGATFSVESGHSLTFYDQSNWGDYAVGRPFQSVTYTPTPHKNRTSADLVDAKLELDGSLIMNSGSYFLTTGEQSQANVGARIISPRRTGIIQLSDATSFPEVHQCTQSGSDITYVSIPRSCAKLQNGDHSYTQSAPGNTYHYDKVLDRWSLSTDHATKSGLFKTIDNNGVIKTVLLENDVMATSRTGLFHYSSSATYKAGDNHYYYLQAGVVVSNKKWYQEGGKWYFFGTNQYAYQGMSAVFTASTGITGFGIQARYFFNDAATVERLVTVNNVVGLSQDITISTIDTVKYCYYKSIKAGVGLFEKQSGSNYSVYLAKDDGTLMANGTYYVPSYKINNIKDSSGKVLTGGLYYFDENGHMYDSNFKEITRGTAS
ncbi:MAG: hypothetical protein ACI4QP_06170 [Candidatus Enteromonas sp.]